MFSLQPNKNGTAGRRRRKKQDNKEDCLVEENQYVTLDEGTKTVEENTVEERIKEGEEEKKILNTANQEDLAIEDVELAPSDPEPVVSNSAVATAAVGADVVFFPDTGHTPDV